MNFIKNNLPWLAWGLTSVLVLSCAPKPVHASTVTSEDVRLAQTTEIQGDNFSVIVYEPYKLNTVGLHLGTKHFSQNKVSSKHAQGTWNDINPGVYVKLQNGMTFGTYYNSERKQSAYVGRTFSKNLTQNLEIAATVGIISGYNKSVLPLVLPTVAYKFHQDFAARVGFVPKVNKQGSAGLHFMVEKQF